MFDARPGTTFYHNPVSNFKDKMCGRTDVNFQLRIYFKYFI
jgi:hypothetical protein